MLRHLIIAVCLFAFWGGRGLLADEVLPPAPQQYVTDQAGVISPAVIAQLNRQLADFEKQTSNQIVAVVYNALPEGAEISDYTQRLYHAWKIGQKKTSNGVLLLVFVKDRKVRIQTGYGLEGALPDVLCSRIIRETILPSFRSGNYTAGLEAGINAIIQATKGEYKGVARKSNTLTDFLFSPFGFFLLVVLVLIIANRFRGGGGPGGIDPGSAATGFFIGSGGGGGWGGGSSDGGGGFSGGGGDSGGGGAGGSW